MIPFLERLFWKGNSGETSSLCFLLPCHDYKSFCETELSLSPQHQQLEIYVCLPLKDVWNHVTFLFPEEAGLCGAVGFEVLDEVSLLEGWSWSWDVLWGCCGLQKQCCSLVLGLVSCVCSTSDYCVMFHSSSKTQLVSQWELHFHIYIFENRMLSR